MSAKGTAVINFGAAPGAFNCLALVTGQTEILADASCEAWMSTEATDDHSADEHVIAPIRLFVGAIVPGVGFTIQAISDWQLTGQFSVRWVWVA